MGFDRRLFLGGTGAIIGCTLGRAGIAEAEEVRNGRTPITRAEWDTMIRNTGQAGFTCVRTTQATEGPFYYESSLLRRAIAEGRPGVPLRLGITVGGVLSGVQCVPLAGAIVDLWQTDATGLYSNVGADLQLTDTSGQTFLRGHQITDEHGYVEFETIVPGWEIVPAAAPVGVATRTTHIHVKVFHAREVLTTQLYFPDPLIDHFYAETEPYKSHRMLTAPGLDRSYERIRNGQDRFYTDSKAQPMAIGTINGVLTAKATLGLVSQDTRNLQTLFR
jgi:protocatechuate 3,4-dioxygenase beta subunit